MTTSSGMDHLQAQFSFKGVKVPVKYRHPEDPEKTWTGRGVMPAWLQALINAGRDRSEFEV